MASRNPRVKIKAMNGDRGKFITLEGVEGCGKTTQARLLNTFLTQLHLEVALTKEPGGTFIGGQIRKILLHPQNVNMDPRCETLLYLADRAQHVSEFIRPKLERGTWVISDRYHDSTVAYQGAARGVSSQELAPLFQMATGNLIPDLTLVLDMDPHVSLVRAQVRNRQCHLEDLEGRFENEALQFHTKVRQGFLDLARREPKRVFLVDASGTVEEIQLEIRRVLQERWVELRV